LDNKMHFQVNQNGKSYKIVYAEALPVSFAFKAGLDKNGVMRLFIDDKPAGTAKAAGLFAKDVEVPVRVGVETQDGINKIGAYPDSAIMLRSNLKVKLETLDGPVATAKEVAKIDKVITINVLKNVMKY